METKKLYNTCSNCKQAEAIWHLRAHTKFVCEECRKEIEYRQPEPEGAWINS